MINNADPDQLASEKPNDPDLCCLQKWGISGFSRTRVKWTGSWLGTDSSTKHAWVIHKRKTIQMHVHNTFKTASLCLVRLRAGRIFFKMTMHCDSDG